MKKTIIFAAAFIGFASAVNAQNASGSAQQTVQLALSNALEITFTGSNSATGTTVSIPFTTVNDYANGVESAAQVIKVRSNKSFNVTAKANSAFFSVTNGSNTTASTMPASVLEIKVSANNTGGTIATGYTGYKDLTTTAANILTGASNGGNQNFSVMYNAQPGFAYPAGTYTMDVVYTATQQ